MFRDHQDANLNGVLVRGGLGCSGVLVRGELVCSRVPLREGLGSGGRLGWSRRPHLEELLDLDLEAVIFC
ncbi:unnamed protein product [Prunus armeniaca]